MLTPFQEKVLDALKKIPKGKVTTYSHLAKYLKKPKAVRAVGTAVGKNPNLVKVPCHRVVRSDGKIGQYSGKGGTKGKIALLEKEGVKLKDGKILNLDKDLYKFK